MSAAKKRDSASWAAGSQSQPAAHFVRFTKEQNKRLHDAARRGGWTIASFLHDAAMAALEANEDRICDRVERRQAIDEMLAPPAAAAEPRGFGLRVKAALRKPLPPEPPEPPAPVPVQSPQIVINAPGETQSARAPIDDLAAWVRAADGNDERATRAKTARDILAASAGSPDEADRREKLLVEKIGPLPAASAFSVIDDLLGRMLKR